MVDFLISIDQYLAKDSSQELLAFHHSACAVGLAMSLCQRHAGLTSYINSTLATGIGTKPTSYQAHQGSDSMCMSQHFFISTWHNMKCNLILLKFQIWSLLHTWQVFWLTGAVRFTPRPLSCSLTHASIVSHQVVACVTTVGGRLPNSSPSQTHISIYGLCQHLTNQGCK